MRASHTTPRADRPSDLSPAAAERPDASTAERQKQTPLRCFTAAHIAQWWGVNRSAVTMMRKRWGPNSAAPFPEPDVEIPTVGGDTVVLGWEWSRWPQEFVDWDNRCKEVPRQRAQAVPPTGQGRRSRAAAVDDPAPGADVPWPAGQAGAGAEDRKIRVRDYLQAPGRRSRVRQGRVASTRVARAVANGKIAR